MKYCTDLRRNSKWKNTEWSINLTFLCNEQAVGGREQLEPIIYQPSQIRYHFAFMPTNSSQCVPATHSNVRVQIPIWVYVSQPGHKASICQDGMDASSSRAFGCAPSSQRTILGHMKNLRKFQLISKTFRTLQCSNMQKESL